MEKLPRTGGEREKEGKGGRKGPFEGVKCAKEMSKESFSGKSNPQNPITGSKSGETPWNTTKKGRF